MDKKWVLKPEGHTEAINQLAADLRINRILVNLLVQRGIKSYEEARNFFRPSLDHLHDPFLMADMDKAIDRINEALQQKEKILIYGDYDVDGTSAVALVYSFLSNYISFKEQIDYYIPDRYKEGYGISLQGIDWAKEHGFTLIIALDCGIKSNDKIDYANERGVDFIICDHHRPGTELPSAVAVLDPKRSDCNYPYKELSGCGIGFKLAQGFAAFNNIPSNQLESYLDLVAISIAADIVPITGENRVLAYYGLQQLNRDARPGIKAILELSGMQARDLTVNDIVFNIAPRINAAGRIEHGTKAVELMISKREDLAGFLSDYINEHNTTRKNLDSLITDQALQQIEMNPAFKALKTTVVYHPEWHKGVIGIVASRLTDKYYRPTIVLTRSNGLVSGSARSVKDFDIYNAIESCSDLLEQFGGHMYAAGLTMKEENVEAFRKRFEECVQSTIKEHMLTREIEIDAHINLKEITPSFYKILKQFAPFGPGNMAPVFRATGVRDNGRGRVVGNNHLKLTLTQEGPGVFDGIAFQLGHHHPMVEQKEELDIVFHIEENNFNNRTTLQLNIKDLKSSNTKVFA